MVTRNFAGGPVWQAYVLKQAPDRENGHAPSHAGRQNLMSCRSSDTEKLFLATRSFFATESLRAHMVATSRSGKKRFFIFCAIEWNLASRGEAKCLRTEEAQEDHSFPLTGAAGLWESRLGPNVLALRRGTAVDENTYACGSTPATPDFGRTWASPATKSARNHLFHPAAKESPLAF